VQRLTQHSSRGEKPMCSSGLLLDLDLAFGSFLRGKKNASETTGPSDNKKISMDRCWQLSISVGSPLGFQYTTHAHFDTQGAHR
jgi:hypothetical protein